jgi:hypothetical protein
LQQGSAAGKWKEGNHSGSSRENIRVTMLKHREATVDGTASSRESEWQKAKPRGKRAISWRSMAAAVESSEGAIEALSTATSGDAGHQDSPLDRAFSELGLLLQVVRG